MAKKITHLTMALVFAIAATSCKTVQKTNKLTENQAITNITSSAINDTIKIAVQDSSASTRKDTIKIAKIETKPSTVKDTIKTNDSEPKLTKCNETPPKKSSCKAFFRSWFYDKNTNQCKQISDSGCSKKGFSTKEECEECKCK